jgi:hypothetical protein
MTSKTLTARGTRKTTRLRKIECPACGLILRGARGPLAAAGLPVCACGCPMQWAELEDAYAVLDGAELYAHALVAEEEARHDRRLARNDHGIGLKRSTVGQCGGCRKPITATNERCSCGFANDLRGRRNRGGYGEPDSGAWPF